MGRFVVEKVIVPALEALRDPKEQVYLGLTLATVLVLLFGPGGVTTGSQATNSPGSYYRGGSKSPLPSLNTPSGGTSDQTQNPVKKIDPNQLPAQKKNNQQDEVPVSHGEQTVSAHQPQPAARLVNPNELPSVKKPAPER